MQTAGLSLEEFKARLPLAEIVARYVKLVRRGREHQGLCPFHQEKTPSFSVVEDKGFYHCFGCGAHGTAIDFVMAVERLEFRDALSRLAELTGLTAPHHSGKPEPEPSQRLVSANEAAAAWFRERLASAQGRPARDYLERRGVTREAQRAFRIGWAPAERAGLGEALGRQGFGEDELLAAGLLVRPEGERSAFDRFRDRIMFPIADGKGRLVGFGGRALGEAKAKYLNTPDTELFHKGSLLFNFTEAVGPAREARAVLVAEGYLDVIALWQAGYRHAVAPLGTAITEQQLRLLWRLAEAPLLCLDGDRAGMAAAVRLAERALPLMLPGKSLRFALLPQGEDPDSFLKRHGAAALAPILAKADPLSQLVWRMETQGRRFDTPETRAQLTRRLRAFANLASDHDLRRSLDASFKELLTTLFERRSAPRHHAGARPASSRPAGWAGGWEGAGAARLAAGLPDPDLLRELRLLAPVLAHPEWLPVIEEGLAALELRQLRAAQLRQELMAWFAHAGRLDAADLRSHLIRYGFGPALDQLDQLGGGGRQGPEAGETGLLESWQAMLRSYRVVEPDFADPARLRPVPLPGRPEPAS